MREDVRPLATELGAPFGDACRDLRLAAGLTQEALAEWAGISARSIRNLERARSMPYKDTVRRLVVALGLGEGEAARLIAAATPTPRRRTPAGSAPASSSLQALPVSPTALVGRSADVALVGTLLRRHDVRLVTLTGPGGVGKTRLGLAVAAEVRSAFQDGVAFVSLASTADPALVPVA